MNRMMLDDEPLEEKISEKEYQKRIAQLSKSVQELLHSGRRYRIPIGKGNEIKFALIGDTHYGSKYERPDALAEFLKLAKSEGCEVVLHAGDIVAGHHVYPGQEFELYAHGMAEQIDLVVKKFPKILPIKFITGNHDDSFKKIAGATIGNAIAKERADMEFLGEYSAMVELKTPTGRTFRVQLVHPDGGTCYALSYKTQKYIESISGGQKPNMLGIGHFHKAELLPAYRNVAGVQVGAFEAQTPFLLRKGSPSHVGGWIVRVMVGTEAGLSNRIQAEFIAFYEKKD